MTLGNIVILLVLTVIVIQFWRIRGITEYVNRYLRQYCESLQLQLVSVARTKTKIAIVRGKPDWHTHFVFEFSSDGSNKYTGTLEARGMSIVQTDIPPHKIN